MFSFFKKKKIVPHIKLNGVIGNVGKFKQGIDFSGQEELIKKAFSIKKAIAVAINEPRIAIHSDVCQFRITNMAIGIAGRRILKSASSQNQ